MPLTEVKMLYEMNRSSSIQVKTPVGTTESFTAEEIVKQGTVTGPIICCIETVINQWRTSGGKLW